MSAELILRPHPFTMEHGVFPVTAGQTIAGMLREAAGGLDFRETLRVEVGGYEVPRAYWDKLRPKAGVPIHVTGMPAGGDDGKTLRSVLLIAVSVAAMWMSGPGGAVALFGQGASWTALGSAVVGAAVMVGGTMLVNKLVPPPKAPSAGGGDGMASINMLTGSSNQAAPYGPIPLVLGECRFYPPHAALPYSEMVGDTQYQHCLFDLGHGDIAVSDIKIGETPIDQYDDVEYEITRTPTLYRDDVNEVSVSAQMNDGDDVIRTTAPEIDEISLEVMFYQGLFGVDSKGRTVPAEADLTIEYRASGTLDPWTAAPSIGVVQGGVKTRAVSFKDVLNTLLVGNGDRKPFAASYAWGVARGQYDVRVRRGTTNWNGADTNGRVGDAQWSVLRSIRERNPSNTGTNKLAMRIKASEQLNGTLQTLSCIVSQKIKVYDSATQTWSAPQINRNPAWVTYWLMTECPAVSGKVVASRINLDDFADFAAYCVTHDFEIRGVLDTRVTMRQLLDDVLACGTGALSSRDGKYGVIFDSGSTIPTMAFSPLDMKELTVSRAFSNLPHALRVKFKNPAANWVDDEIVVPADGYSWRGKDARGNASTDPEATEFESLDLRWIGDVHSAWRIARYHFAQTIFRPNVYSWVTDIANLGCTRGDLVYLAHDVVEWGTGWGRIKSISGSTVTIDEAIELPAGPTYSARIRLQDGTSQFYSIVQTAPNVFDLTPAPSGVSLGDVFVVGETTRMNERLLVTGIYPEADLGARIAAVNYDDRVAPYWANPPVTIVSEITGTAFRDPPPAPNITVVISDQQHSDVDDGGGTSSETHVYLRRPGGGYVRPGWPRLMER